MILLKRKLALIFVIGALLIPTAFAATLTITSPNGGEVWQAGDSRVIMWNTTGSIPNVRLDCSIDNGQTWSTIVSSLPNTSSYNWTVPSVGTWRARIRISSVDDPLISDICNGKFSINHAVWPVSGTTTPDLMASQFGSRMLSGVYDFHRGLDAPSTLNTPVHPMQAGVVARFEDTSQTIGTARERFGNWILVQHRSVSGIPRHTAYLHLNAFGSFSVGDTVSTLDVIGLMGRSGVGINTIHTHFELYKNLSGTSIDADKAFNPIELLSYADSNRYGFDTVQRNDSSAAVITVSSTELDVVRFSIYGSLATKIVDFNTRAGIDPSDNDNPRYNGVFIEPQSFTRDSLTLLYRFWTKNNEVGRIDSVRIQDTKGYSKVFVAGSLPVQLSSFSALQSGSQSVRLEWRTITEINNYGFFVQRKIGTGDFSDLLNAFVAGHGTTNQAHAYSFVDSTASGTTLWYRLRQVDLDGSLHFTEPVQVAITNVAGNEAAPSTFTLFQNYPNPFNPSTEIQFSVERTARASLDVYNALGQKVLTLFDEMAEPGNYYRVRFDGSSLSSGVYYYRLRSETMGELKKLILLK